MIILAENIYLRDKRIFSILREAQPNLIPPDPPAIRHLLIISNPLLPPTPTWHPRTLLKGFDESQKIYSDHIFCLIITDRF